MNIHGMQFAIVVLTAPTDGTDASSNIFVTTYSSNTMTIDATYGSDVHVLGTTYVHVGDIVTHNTGRVGIEASRFGFDAFVEVQDCGVGVMVFMLASLEPVSFIVGAPT